MTAPLDRRLTPARPEFAAAFLRGSVTADRFVDGERRRIAVGVADVRAEPRFDCSLDTQAIFGEAVVVYEWEEGYAFVQCERDGYVGFVPEAALTGNWDGAEPTHRVTALRSLRFPGPDLKLPIMDQLPQGSLVAVREIVERRGLSYAVLADGTATVARHLEPIDEPAHADHVEVAAAYIGTPYLWGGRTSLGIDCSGLVQTALSMVGIDAPRDSDMQEASVGTPVDIAERGDWRRGDLLFWRGHVGILSGPGLLLHANGHHMAVIEETLAEALTRISAAGLEVTSVRRPRPLARG